MLHSFSGIALRKVEERKEAAAAQEASKDNGAAGASGGGSSGSGEGKSSSGTGGGQSDVASILARRVAVEMSDSECDGAAGASDSEYDSDDWGDESQA